MWLDWLIRMGVVFALLFWAVGAHSRLVGLHKPIAVAWTQIAELLGQRDRVLRLLIEALRHPLASEAGTLDAVVNLLAVQARAAQAAGRREQTAQAVQDWRLAEADLASPLARLMALVELHPGLAGDARVADLRRQLLDWQPQIAYARQRYNDAADRFNAALEEAPTRWLRPLLRMRDAALL